MEPADRTIVLELRDLHGQRGDFRLTVPGLRLRAGQALAVTGPSGCGKSTLLDLLGLVLRPAAAGAFRVMGQDVSALWAGGAGGQSALAGLRAGAVGYILQTGGLLPYLSVAENIGLSPRLLGQTMDRGWFDHLVTQLGLQDHLKKAPRLLSIGQRQRVAMARALAHRPPLVLADEPTAALDPATADRALALLLGLSVDSGSALVLVSHDQGRIAGLGIPVLSGVIGTAGEPVRFGPEAQA
ncbi:ABC transporter ATP-binding protein [Novispirillum itersonii]|uniref:Putative ABC transport system ATP-binding protein n=1 Tax=Novispirillum itersonii TaxID=189 RepID=A0A7W9ZIR3_NOVIT|nr:ATP-binding cassette domain-containing protein [Novispirillum itersonii]MBB6212241.1 putative ABC transport system ATP-binding protein [Novispirillum itersonii]